MNIACDARALIGPLTGVGRWTVELAAGLAETWGHQVMLAASKPFELPAQLRHPSIRRLPPPPLPWPGTLWLHSALPGLLAAAGADVHVASLAIVPRRSPVPTVAMVHDLTPRTHPHRHTLANRFCFNAYLEESLERAAAVVVGSAATAAVLEAEYLKVRPRLVRISYGVDPELSPAPPDDDGADVRRRFAAGRPYLLHLGTLEPRKGVAHLITAWERLQAELPAPPDLVLAGAPGWGARAIAERCAASPLAGRIHRPGYVSRADARQLLRHAAAFVLASEVEGFGLPLVEAIACGAPCVASDIPSLREAAGDAAVFAAPADPDALAAAIRRVLTPAVAAGLRRRAAVRARQLGWAPVVASWHELLQEVGARG